MTHDEINEIREQRDIAIEILNREVHARHEYNTYSVHIVLIQNIDTLLDALEQEQLTVRLYESMRHNFQAVVDANYALIDERDKLKDELNKWRDAAKGAEVIVSVAQGRIKSLERAIKSKSACATCSKKPEGGYCAELYDCVNENFSYPCWVFDEARFTAGEKGKYDSAGQNNP